MALGGQLALREGWRLWSQPSVLAFGSNGSLQLFFILVIGAQGFM